MAWFLNFYQCERCLRRWTDEWSCMCDDQCPNCGFRDMTPYKSDDMTEMVEQVGAEFVVLRSPDGAEDDPAYRELGRFPTRASAEAFLDAYDPQ